VGVIFCPRYLGRDGVEAVADHLMHVLEVAGEETPALGSDWDGFIRPTRGLEEPSKLPVLTDALLARGVPERAVRKLLRDNAVRVLRDAGGRADADDA
jgi:membrane dipeptidase